MIWQRDANSARRGWVSGLVLLAGTLLLGTPTAAAAPTIITPTITPTPITPGDFLSATFVGSGFGQTPGIFEFCDDAALTQCHQFSDSLPDNWDLTWSDTQVLFRVYPVYTSHYTPGTKTYYVRIYNSGKAVSNVKPVDVTVAQASPPTLTTLTPDSGPTGGWLQFTIRGAGFTTSTRIKAWDGLDRLRAEWYEGIMPGPELLFFRFVDATRIDVGCKTYVPYGDYQVAASNAAGTSNRLTFHLLPGTSLHLRSIPFTERYIDSAGGVHPIELYELTNRRTGTLSHLLLALPASDSAATAPYPTIVFTNPYDLFSAPPSQDAIDVYWSGGIVPPHTCGFYPDVSFPQPSAGFEQLMCSTHPCSIFTCSAPLAELGVTEVATSLRDWALRNGYAVVSPFGRFYAARDLLSAPYEITGAIEALKTLSSVDGSRIGITGGSLGGYQTIYPISRGDMPLTVAAAVAEVAPVDFRTMYEYYFTMLPAVQPEALLRASQDFAIPYFNRLFQAVGTTPMHSAWDPLVNTYVADHIQSPLLLIAGTDDMMVPSSQSAALYAALRSREKSVNQWIYQNGEPPFATKSAPEWGHGVMDQHASVKRRVLTQLFFLHYIPPDVPRVTLHDPDDVEILAMLRELRQTVCNAPEEQPNISDILRYAASPKLHYVSAVSELASGDGPTVMAEAINQVWSLEGIHWTAQSVRANLEAGLLPARCGAPSNNAVFVAQSVPKMLVAGQSSTASVTMKNMGTIAWTHETNHRLGSQNPQDNLIWKVGRVALGPSESIAPGQQKTFRFRVTAPTTAGAYPFQWRMLQEEVEWFGDFSPNVVMQVSADRTPPMVTLTKPASGATVSGSVTVQARASDNVGVGRVDFFVDGGLQGSDSTAPYTYAWDATRWVHGPHTLKAIAVDTADNSANHTVRVTTGRPSPVTLTVSPTSLRAEGRLTVRWRVPAGQASTADWLGLYNMGAPNDNYLASRSTRGALTGTTTFTAPRSAGTYEVRYLGKKNHPSVSKSSAITVRFRSAPRPRKSPRANR